MFHSPLAVLVPISSTDKSAGTACRLLSPRGRNQSPPYPQTHLALPAATQSTSAVTSASSQSDSLSGQTVQVTALCPIPEVSAVDTEVGVSETLVACYSLPAMRSSACVMVEPMPEWSELSTVFDGTASKTRSNRFHPSTKRADAPMSAISPAPRMMISRQCPAGREISRFRGRV